MMNRAAMRLLTLLGLLVGLAVIVAPDAQACSCMAPTGPPVVEFTGTALDSYREEWSIASRPMTRPVWRFQVDRAVRGVEVGDTIELATTPGCDGGSALRSRVQYVVQSHHQSNVGGIVRVALGCSGSFELAAVPVLPSAQEPPEGRSEEQDAEAIVVIGVALSLVVAAAVGALVLRSRRSLEEKDSISGP